MYNTRMKSLSNCKWWEKKITAPSRGWMIKYDCDVYAMGPIDDESVTDKESLLIFCKEFFGKVPESYWYKGE